MNESEENKRIYKEYKQWYESVRNQEYERRKRTQEENIKDNNITNKITAIHVSITKVRMMMELFKNLKNILIFWELIKMGKLLIGLYTKHF